MFSENHLSEYKSWSVWNARKIIGNRPFAGRWRGRNIFELPNIQVIYFGLCSAKKSTYYRFSIFVRQSVSSICMCHIFKIMKKKVWWCLALGFANNHSILHVLIFSSSPSPSSRSYGFPSVLPSVCSSINSSSHQKVNYFFWLPLNEPVILPTECQETLIRHHTNLYEGRTRSRVGKNLTLKKLTIWIWSDQIWKGIKANFSNM